MTGGGGSHKSEIFDDVISGRLSIGGKIDWGNRLVVPSIGGNRLVVLSIGGNRLVVN